MWLVLSHQEPQTQYKSEIKEKTLSRQESLDGLRISQKSAKTPLFTEFSDGLGGVSLKAISHILSILILFAGLLLITSCEKEITPPAYQSQLQRYHTESLALQQVTADSVHRFQLKVSDFAVAFPEVTSEQLYHQIRQNIYDAYLTIGIEPGAWGEDKEIEFTFGNQ